MKTMIAVPCMDQVAAEFAQSLATLKKVGDCTVVFQMSSLVYDSRNNLMKTAITTGADFVMWFDSDMVFAPDTLERLMADLDEGRDIVTGIYFRRRPPYTPVLMSKLTDDGVEDVLDYPEEIFKVEGCGFGCVLMRTDVARNILLECGNWFTPEHGLGEDLAFCRRAKETGYKIYCDPRVKCGHVGHAVITEDFYKSVKGGSDA